MTSSPNHWTILGAGAVGHLLACGFTRSNIPAELIYRNQQPFNQSTICYRYKDTTQDCELNYLSIEQLLTVKNLLLTVKSYQVEAAILSIKKALTPSSQIFLLQNGMGTLEKVSSLLSDIIDPKQIFPGVNTHGSYLHTEKGITPEVVHAGFGSLTFGNNFLHPSEKHKPVEFSDLKSLPLNVNWSSDIKHDLWLKLAINAAINPVTALNRCKNGEITKSSTLKNQVELLCLETAELFKTLDINIALDDILSSVFDVCEKTADNQSSMLQDVKSGIRTEIEAINGHLLRKAHEHNISMKFHQKLYQQILMLQKI